MRLAVSRLYPLLVAAVLVAGCASTSSPLPSPLPSASHVDYAAMGPAIENHIRSDSLRLTTINAVLVTVDSEMKLEHYRNARGPDDAVHVWSVTKSVVSALIGMAIDDQLITGLDATLPELLPRYAGSLGNDEKQITLRHLMSMTAGFPADEPLENLHKLFAQKSDPVTTILTEGLEQPPGQGFIYSSRSAHLVSAVLREALVRADPQHPRSVLDYAREKLFDPLGIDTSGALERQTSLVDASYEVATHFDWATDATGLHNGCCMLRLRPADLTKFGELYRQTGVWNGKRILSDEWVRLTTAPSEVNPYYGLMWWLDADAQGHQAWLAKGWGGQVVAVIPEHRLVVAVASVPNDAAGFIEGDAAWHLADDTVIAAVE